MDYPPSYENSPGTSWMDRFQALFEVLLVSGLISSILAALPFSLLFGKNVGRLLGDVRFVSMFLLLESGITFLLLMIMLKAHRESFRSLGWRRDRWKYNLALGLGLVPLLFLINAAVSFVFRVYIPKYSIDHNPLLEIIHTPQQLVLFIFAALIAGGFKEELQRAFILNKFRRFLGGAAAGLILWSLAFGAGHYVQGVQGVFLAVIYGFLFGIVYLMSGSLVAPIVAHGTYDTLALLGYWLFSK